MMKIQRGERPSFNFPIPSFYKNLIENCWCQTPRERITFDEIVSILRNDPSFITSDINQKEYYEYIENDDKFTEQKLNLNINIDIFHNKNNEFFYFIYLFILILIYQCIIII